jgi:glutamate-ammonia-ligase adenylyltransferase
MPGNETSHRHRLPEPADPAAVALFWEKTSLRPTDPAQRALVEAMAGGSPFLRHLMLVETDFAARVLAEEPGRLLDELIVALAAASRLEVQAEFQRVLRQTRARAALAIAAADIAGLWTVDEVTAALTRFADAALNAAVNWLLREGARGGKLSLSDVANPGHGCGYVVLAMGKHGAFELNYSSDIDLIVLYDPRRRSSPARHRTAVFFVR